MSGDEIKIEKLERNALQLEHKMNRLAGYNFNNPNNEIEFCVTFFLLEVMTDQFFPTLSQGSALLSLS